MKGFKLPVCAVCGNGVTMAQGHLSTGGKDYHYDCWKQTPTALIMRRGVVVEEIARLQKELGDIGMALAMFAERRRSAMALEDKLKAIKLKPQSKKKALANIARLKEQIGMKGKKANKKEVRRINYSKHKYCRRCELKFGLDQECCSNCGAKLASKAIYHHNKKTLPRIK